MSGSWLKDTFEKGVDELQKLAKTGSIKIDITNLKKKRDERVKLIGNKILQMIKNGEIKAEIFEPDYSYILEMDKKIEKKEAELYDREYIPPVETKSAAPVAEPETEEPVQEIVPPKPAQNVPEEEERDPHEDYINRPG